MWFVCLALVGHYLVPQILQDGVTVLLTSIANILTSDHSTSYLVTNKGVRLLKVFLLSCSDCCIPVWPQEANRATNYCSVSSNFSK